MLDTASTRNLVGATWLKTNSPLAKVHRPDLPLSLTGATGPAALCRDYVELCIFVGSTSFTALYWVVNDANFNILTGVPTLSAHGASIDCRTRTATINGVTIPWLDSLIPATATASYVIIPGGTALVSFSANGVPEGATTATFFPLLEPHSHSLLASLPFKVEQCVVTLVDGMSVLVKNLSKSQDCRIFCGQRLGTLSLFKLDVPHTPSRTYTKCLVTDSKPLFAISPALSAVQKDQLDSLLARHSTGPNPVLVVQLSQGGRAKVAPHRVVLTTDVPPRVARRRPTALKQGLIKKETHSMLGAGIIEHTDSSYAAPVHLVIKKTGDVRFCVDYTALNEITVPDAHPIPRIDDLVAALAGSKFFTTLDLASGFWQIPVHPDDAKKIAFICDEGLFTWRAMPFGLRNAPATFQRAMQTVFAGMKGVSVYFDDILVHSQGFDEHMLILADVFDRLAEFCLEAKISKCRFACTEVAYLGRVVSGSGSSLDPAVIRAIVDCVAPTNIEQVRVFLGKLNFYREFMENLATTAEPLYRLLDKGTVFGWTPRCQEAFVSLKKSLTDAPILAMPVFNDSTRIFILYTDASDVGLSAVLCQLPAGETFSIARSYPYVACWSKALKPSEKRYTVTQRECLAIVRGVEAFRYFLGEELFYVVTDHSALVHLLPSSLHSDHIVRWARRLLGYRFKVFHKKGSLHANADSLSRAPFISVDDGVASAEALSLFTAAGNPLSATPLHEIDWASVQLSDEYCNLIHSYLAGSVPVPTDLESKALRAVVRHCIIDNGVIWHRHGTSQAVRILVPLTLRPLLLKLFHDNPLSGGHFGPAKTLLRLSETFFWPSMSVDSDKHVSECAECARAKAPRERRPGLLKPIIANEAWQIVGMDVVPLPTSTDGYSNVLVMVDYFSKWLEAVPLRDTSSASIWDAFYSRIVCQFGIPRQVVSDNAANLNSEEIISRFNSLSIKKSHSTSYHQQTDGQAERTIQTLKNMLRAYVSQHPQDWTEFVDSLRAAYNQTPHSSTSFSPYRVLFGTDPRSFKDVLINTEQFVDPNAIAKFNASLTPVAIRSHATILAIRSLVRKHLSAAAAAATVHYDKKRQPAVPLFTSGSYAWLRPFGAEPSGLEPKLIGPYRVRYTPAANGVVTLQHSGDLQNVYKTNVSSLVLARLPPTPEEITLIPPLPRITGPKDSSSSNAFQNDRREEFLQFRVFFKSSLHRVRNELFVEVDSPSAVAGARAELSELFQSPFLTFHPDERKSHLSSISLLDPQNLISKLDDWHKNFDKIFAHCFMN